MELRYYFSTLGRRKNMILTVMIAMTVVSVVATLWLIPTTYNAGLFMTISYRDDQVTEQYKYGGYHANMSAIEFTQTFSAWPKSPKLVDEVYVRAGVIQQEDQTLLAKFLGPLSAKRDERANIEISLTSKSAANAEKLINAVLQVLTEKLEQYNTNSATRYKINNPSTSFETKQPTLETNIPIGIIVGFLLGIVLAYLYEYFAGVVTTATEAEALSGLERSDIIPRSAATNMYSFLASVLLSEGKGLPALSADRHGGRQGRAVLAGVSFNPTKHSLKLAHAVSSQAVSAILVDMNLERRTLHTFFKGHRKMKKGHTDARSASELNRCIYKVEGEPVQIIPAGSGDHAHGAVLSSFAHSHRSPVLFHTQLPENSEILTMLSDLPLVLFVQLGQSKSDDVRKLTALYKHRKTYLVVIK